MSEEEAIELRAAIVRRLDDGDARMTRIETALAENTRLTAEVRSIMEAGRAGLRLLGWVGFALKWLGVIATALVAIRVAFYVATHGGDLPANYHGEPK